MTLDELLTKERNLYIATFQRGLEQQKTNSSAIEIMLQITGDQNKTLPEIFQLNRFDLVNRNNEGKLDLIEFNLDKDSLLKFDKQVYDFNGMKVEVNPFIWNGCELTLDKKPANWESYYDWARKWIDIGDKKKVTADGFQNVIHSVTFPKGIDGSWTTSIDFGSSPIEAFKELITIFSKQGIKKIEIHSKTFSG